jgi:hypothetical protein
MRHTGTLPADYQSRLENMSLREIAIEAAQFRSDHRDPGTMTALILRWVRRRYTSGVYHRFLRLYSACWNAERVARDEKLSARPAHRPVMGGRKSRARLHRHEGLAYSC